MQSVGTAWTVCVCVSKPVPRGTNLLYAISLNRHGLYHSREQLHPLQQTMYFDDAIYPQLPQPLLDRILRIRALINMSPRILKGKGKGTPPTLPDPTDDPVTSIPQEDLIHPFPNATSPHDTTCQSTTTIPPQTSTTHSDSTATALPPSTPDFPLTTHTPHAPTPKGFGRYVAPAPTSQPHYTCMRAANSCISPPRPINLSLLHLLTPPHTAVIRLKYTAYTFHYEDTPPSLQQDQLPQSHPHNSNLSLHNHSLSHKPSLTFAPTTRRQQQDQTVHGGMLQGQRLRRLLQAHN